MKGNYLSWFKGFTDYTSAVVQVMVWHRTGNKLKAKLGAGLLLVGSLVTHIGEIWIKTREFLIKKTDFENIICKIPAMLSRAHCDTKKICSLSFLNTLRPRRNEQHFADDIFKRIFFNENVWISIKISLKFVSKGSINNIPALVQIMAWRRSGDKPLSEPMMVSLPTHICVMRPQWVNNEMIWIVTIAKNSIK